MSPNFTTLIKRTILQDNDSVRSQNDVLFSSGVDWGPKRDSLSIVLPVTIAYVFIFITGVFGNITTCIVISKNKSMRTATNYFLFSLAVSDLLLLICGLPPETYSVWSKYPYIFGEIFCIMQGLLVETSANATVLTITSFTIERYIAICHPFLSRSTSNLNRAIKYIIAIWIVALCLAIPQAIPFGVVCETGIEDHCACTIRRFLIPHAFEVSTMVFFIVPMGLISILYILIGMQLRKAALVPPRNSIKLKQIAVTYSSGMDQSFLVCSKNKSMCSIHENVMSKPKDDEQGRRNVGKSAKATRHVIKMLIAVVSTFFICWAPFHAQRLLAIYGKQHHSSDMIKAFKILTYVSGVLYYLSASINPLLYHIMSKKYRKAFKKTYKSLLRKECLKTSKRCCHYTSALSISKPATPSKTDRSSSPPRQNSIQLNVTPEQVNLEHSKRPIVISFNKRKLPPKLDPVIVLRSHFS